MSNLNDRSHRPTRLVVAMSTLGYMLALMPSLAHANDFEIYQSPTGGKKTLVMMLDTSGSMYSTDGGTDTRLDRLKAGMNAVLNSTDTKLNDVLMGVGNFSANGDGSTGQILVPAAPLGAVGSAQRTNLAAAIAGLTANSYTPSAHAYAEAASYLMGTSTYGGANITVSVNVENYKVEASYTSTSTGSNARKVTTFNYTFNKYQCVSLFPINFTTRTQSCSNWGSTISTTYSSEVVPGRKPVPTYPGAPVIDPTLYTGSDVTNPLTGSPIIRMRTVYYLTQPQPYSSSGNPDSGIVNGALNDATYPGIVIDRNAAPASLQYKSPLPALKDRASCDGQGIYFLSDGVPNNTSDAQATTIMKTALQGGSGSASSSDYSTGFNCTGGLLNTSSDSGWACMSKFAQVLYGSPAVAGGSVSTNPSLASIQTAFVGFGANFSSLSSADVVNACHLSSRLKGDACSVDSKTNANPAGGYGNGGFYIANTADEVTYSVVNFIGNLGTSVINPLVTGAATVPIDDLNPNGFQAFGYLRMLEPNPANKGILLWRGNVKKYNVGNGTLKDKSLANVLTTNGSLVTGTTDLWNPSSADGANIALGGAYSKLAVPTTALPAQVRPIFTDVASVTQSTVAGVPDTLVSIANGAGLTAVLGTITNAATDIPTRFDVTNGVSPMKDMDPILKKDLINYFGYNLPLDATAIPATLPAASAANIAMGGSDHAQPIQLSYSATIDPKTGTISARTESVLYGSMEGALHLVDATTGVEQMVFVPNEMLADALKSSTLTIGSQDASALVTPNQGVDGPWVTDPAYKTDRTNGKLVALRMNVYGGLRMGGSSYYGLDLQKPTAPKMLFRISPSTTGFSRMGQSWSKPVLANIRYGNTIKRVMIVGGGYDPQYESSSYVPTTSAPALGNAVYMVDATTGALIWSASSATTNTSGVYTQNQYMIHSVVSRMATIDRDADGLIDSIYFGDLGGQVFRADFNNTYDTPTSKFAVREVRLANLGTDSSGTALTGGKNPRIYEPATVTIHDEGSTTFALINVVSGNRSSPLDVMPTIVGGHAVTGILPNKVFGLIDRDMARTDLIKLNSGKTAYVNTNGSPSTLNSHDLTLANLQSEPQGLTTVVADKFFPAGGVGVKEGWYRSFSASTDSSGVVTEKADGTIRLSGGMKGFEEPIAITGRLYVTVYDPQGKGIPASSPCDPRVIGETDYQTFCLPYGTCIDTTTGKRDLSKNALSGLQFTGAGTTADTLINAQAIGAGIRGLVLGDNSGTAVKACKDFTLVGNTSGTGNWSCTRKLVQTNWYEKKPNPALVK
jgi:type IV pilus assembly protein PilY1